MGNWTPMRITVVRDLWMTIWKIVKFGASVCRPILTALSVKWQAMGLHNPVLQSPVHVIHKPPASTVIHCQQLLDLSRRYKRCLLKKKEELEDSMDTKGKKARLTESAVKSQVSQGNSSEVLDGVWDIFSNNELPVNDVTLELLEPEMANTPIPQTPIRSAPVQDRTFLSLMTPDPTPQAYLASSHQLGLQSGQEQRPLSRCADSLSATLNLEGSDSKSEPKGTIFEPIVRPIVREVEDSFVPQESHDSAISMGDVAMDIEAEPPQDVGDLKEESEGQTSNKAIHGSGKPVDDILWPLGTSGSARMTTPTRELEVEPSRIEKVDTGELEEEASQLETVDSNGEEEVDEIEPENETEGESFSLL